MARTVSVMWIGKVAGVVASCLLGTAAQAQTAQKVDAEALIGAQKAGGAAAAAYNGKLLEVSNLKVNGFFPVSDALGRRHPALDLRTSKYFDYIACEMTVASSPELAKLAIGQTLIVTGVAAVGTYTLRLTGCQITKLLDPIKPPTVSLADPGDKVQAADVLTDYLRNSVAATLKYKGKTLALSGRLSDVNGTRVKIRGTEYNSVMCPISGPVVSFLQGLPSSQILTLKATVEEMDAMDLKVKDCSVIDPVPPAAPPAAPASQTAPQNTASAPQNSASATQTGASAPQNSASATQTGASAPQNSASAPAKAAAVRWKAALLLSYSPTAVHAGGNWTMTGVASGVPVQVRVDEKEGSPTRGKFFITVAGTAERPMNKAELRAFYDGALPRAQTPGAAPADKEVALALAAALGLKPPKLP